MKKETKLAIEILSALAVVTVLYFVLKKKKQPTAKQNSEHGLGALMPKDNPKIDFIKSVLGSGIETEEGRLDFENKLINMSKQELNDVYDLGVSVQNNTEIKDEAQKARLDVIEKKYNIFV